MSNDLVSDIRALADLWRGPDHTRQCNARYGMGGCTCGYDARLDMAITAVINHIPDGPLSAEDAAEVQMAIAATIGSPAVVEKVVAGNAIMSPSPPTLKDTP